MIDELEGLYRAQLKEFTRAATAISGDPELGRDAVQDAFAKAVRSRRRYRGEGTLEAWVWRIVVNAARDARRKTRPTSALPDVAAHEGSSDRRLSLELLTPRQQEVLFLHHYADLDYSAIGAALGISPGTVGATLTAARKTLRGALLKELAS